MSPTESDATRMYIQRRLVVRFLVFLLVVLSVLSFASIAFGWGEDTYSGKADSGTPTQLSDTSPFYVLLIGTDGLEGTALYAGDIGEEMDWSEQHADSLTLARVDPEAFTITLVTVPSNTVLYDSDEPARDSLSEGGPIQAVYTVERIAGVDIRYYFMLDFSGFEALVNQVGAVDANVRFPIEMQDPVTAKTVRVKPGEDRKLNGPEALAFVRAWEPYERDADAFRQLNVRDVIRGIVGQVLGFEDQKVREVLGTFERNYASDIENGQLISLVTRFYENREAVRVYACTGPYLATTVGDAGEPIIRQSMAAWRELMTVVDAGEDPAAVLPQYAFDGEEPEPAPDSAPSAPAAEQADAAGDAEQAPPEDAEWQ